MKVLVVNNILIGKGKRAGNATENTLRNMFEGMEDVQILQYSLAPEKETFDCGLSYVSTMVCSHNRLLNRFLAYTRQKMRESSQGNKRLWQLWRKMNSLFAYVLEIAPCWVPGKEFSQIMAFQPEVIYTLGADIRIFRMCKSLSYRLDIPVVVHNMDDFYDMKYFGNNPLRKYAMKKLRQLYKQVYKRSVKSIAIGPLMKQEYEQEFSIPFDWVMNCVTVADIPKSSPEKEIKKIIFSGGLHGGRAATILEIAEEIEKTNLDLEVYTGTIDYQLYSAAFSAFNQTSIREFVPGNEMFANLSRADVLLHVESFEEKYVRYFRLSMSTKIPEYLITGKPILCVGRGDVSTVRFLKETHTGIVIDMPCDIGKAIALLSQPSEREKLYSNACVVICECFDSSKVHEKLRSVLAYNVEHF